MGWAMFRIHNALTTMSMALNFGTASNSLRGKMWLDEFRVEG
jgi:hypothetical protein